MWATNQDGERLEGTELTEKLPPSFLSVCGGGLGDWEPLEFRLYQCQGTEIDFQCRLRDPDGGRLS